MLAYDVDPGEERYNQLGMICILPKGRNQPAWHSNNKLGIRSELLLEKRDQLLHTVVNLGLRLELLLGHNLDAGSQKLSGSIPIPVGSHVHLQAGETLITDNIFTVDEP